MKRKSLLQFQNATEKFQTESTPKNFNFSWMSIKNIFSEKVLPDIENPWTSEP